MITETGRRRRQAWLIGLWLAVAIGLAAGAPAKADEGLGSPALGAAASSSKFRICRNQTYALCAAASCFVFDKIAYCRCDVKSGDSISLAFDYDDHRNVCTVNAAGAANGYMVSTFSPPASVLRPRGDQAIYTCPAGTSNGSYGQCDGGICFTSSRGQSFPGFEQPLTKKEIICSCPITTADPQTAKLGYQIVGPYPCQKSFFKNCRKATANSRTGSTIPVGAPTGTAKLLTFLLTGSNPMTNNCPAPRD
jgi:hypothetical protein